MDVNKQRNVHSAGGPIQHVAVLGAGAWGTALALMAARAGRRVTLWAREPEVRQSIRDRRENTAFLPGIMLPETIACPETADAITEADAILVVAPAQYLRAEVAAIAPRLRPGQALIVCAKGLERGTAKLMTEVLAEVAPHALPSILSGPSFADDVARGLPTAVTLAAPSLAAAEDLAGALATPSFRLYASDDPVGAAIGGAVKNVLAIACGIAEGKGFGASARAALIARGFAEMKRFAGALGANPDTLSGLSGLGDLVLTCSSVQSRNFAFGMALGQGADVAAAMAKAHGTVEGAATARPVVDRALVLGVAMPIATGIADLVEGHADVDQVIAGLLSRPLRPEAE